MGDAGIIVTTAFISPYIADRTAAREIHQKAGIPFVEVHIDVPLDVAESRDPKILEYLVDERMVEIRTEDTVTEVKAVKGKKHNGTEKKGVSDNKSIK